MKCIKHVFCFTFFISSILVAQTKQITLEDIWENGTFRTEHMDVLHPMKNGKQYTILNFDKQNMQTSIDVYDYQTLKKVETLLNSKDLDVLPYFLDYKFSDNEDKIILTSSLEQRYRYSTLGVYFVYDMAEKTIKLISNDKIQEPTFSPDGNKIAFSKDNDLFVKDLIANTTTQITYDGEKNKIINGITDWVYEEEFAFVRAFEWNTTSNKIAYIRFDETHVNEFSMDIYGEALYQTQQVFKYPKAGEENAKVSLHIFDLINNTDTEIILSNAYFDFYIPRIKWTKKPNVLCAQYMNRTQKELNLWMINTEANTSIAILNEKNTTYIDVTDNLTFLNDNSFIWTSEKDGYNHIYHYDEYGVLINQITQGEWDVTAFYGCDEKNKTIFYQSVENGSTVRDVYSIKLNGKKKKRLVEKEGTNNATFSADFSYFINDFSNTTIPTEYTLHETSSGNLIMPIMDNKDLVSTLKDYPLSNKEFSTININGNDLNMWTLKPRDFDSSKRYPVLLFQYSGPGSQEVANTWNDANDYWHQYLAQQGLIIVCVDGRGTGFKGAQFKKITQNQLGKYEVEDQIAVAKKIGQLPYVDEKRIGIWGWSYGGFMSSNCLFKGNDVFKMAIAVAPVTSWRFYDTIYTERYMDTPQKNANGYDENSPIAHANKLKGDFLLIHGSADDNVHLQNTMRLADALIKADKPFEWAVYPDKNHGIYGGKTRLHLYKKMTKFIKKNLLD